MPEPQYQTHRPTSHLLIPSKRPLTRPKSPKILNPSSKPATVQIKPAFSTMADSEGESKSKTKSTRIVEVDLSVPPQPFLDPGVWERMKRVSLGQGHGEEDSRRRGGKEREGEGYGELAVRGRMGGIGRERGLRR